MVAGLECRTDQSLLIPDLTERCSESVVLLVCLLPGDGDGFQVGLDALPCVVRLVREAATGECLAFALGAPLHAAARVMEASSGYVAIMTALIRATVLWGVGDGRVDFVLGCGGDLNGGDGA